MSSSKAAAKHTPPLKSKKSTAPPLQSPRATSAPSSPPLHKEGDDSDEQTKHAMLIIQQTPMVTNLCPDTLQRFVLFLSTTITRHDHVYHEATLLSCFICCVFLLRNCAYAAQGHIWTDRTGASLWILRGIGGHGVGRLYELPFMDGKAHGDGVSARADDGGCGTHGSANCCARYLLPGMVFGVSVYPAAGCAAFRSRRDANGDRYLVCALISNVHVAGEHLSWLQLFECISLSVSIKRRISARP